MSAPKMTELETAFCTIINVFDKYSRTEGNNMTLSKKKMKTLMEKELPWLLSCAKKKGASDKLMKNLYEEGDHKEAVTFDEFLELVTKVLLLEHKSFEKSAKKKDASDKLMKDLDENSDNEVDFNEFVTLVAALTCLGHKRFEKVSTK
uniref:Protein S100 n=1 Tax=Leptobrachium leishanense TaxID=445787 RepID=A0A8C5P8N6_9ANUR